VLTDLIDREDDVELDGVWFQNSAYQEVSILQQLEDALAKLLAAEVRD